MTQLSMFPTQITSISSQKIPEINGLRYIPEFIRKDEEDCLAEIINMQEWNLDLKRRVQHYGYRYNYSNKTISEEDYIGPLPGFLEDIAQKLVNLEIFDKSPAYWPNQVIVNEYKPGQGISFHTDSSNFGPVICSLSLLSHCMMDLAKMEEVKSIILEPRSLLILDDEARYQWNHRIKARKEDKLDFGSLKRSTRISVTFRNLLTYNSVF